MDVLCDSSLQVAFVASKHCASLARQSMLAGGGRNSDNLAQDEG
jgi:hypothetical protein